MMDHEDYSVLRSAMRITAVGFGLWGRGVSEDSHVIERFHLAQYERPLVMARDIAQRGPMAATMY